LWINKKVFLRIAKRLYVLIIYPLGSY